MNILYFIIVFLFTSEYSNHSFGYTIVVDIFSYLIIFRYDMLKVKKTNQNVVIGPSGLVLI